MCVSVCPEVKMRNVFTLGEPNPLTKPGYVVPVPADVSIAFQFSKNFSFFRTLRLYSRVSTYPRRSNSIYISIDQP